MKQNSRTFNSFEYFLEDCECQYCAHARDKERSCKQGKCPYDDIKKTAVAKGRVKRKGRNRI
jgi:hypothetical protein